MTQATTPRLRHIIDPVAFFIALVGGPILFTLATFWLLLIPVFALGFGAIPYLLLATPTLLVYMRRNPATPASIARVSLASFVVGWLICTALATQIMGAGIASAALWILAFGTLFAPCWGASFGWLYVKLARDFYAKPIPH